MAAALIPAATLGWRRLLAAGLVAGALTTAAEGPSHAVWIWWAPIVAGLLVLLGVCWPRPGLHEDGRRDRGELRTLGGAPVA
jgi:hypothetical protein